MPVNKRNTRNTWIGPDDAPELTDDFFRKADLYKGDRLIKRGRPKLDKPKIAISLRLPPEVLARWKATGTGWQTRMAASLKRHAP